jgi:MFS transporter, Spinster family, sphingosine-1-phosphate transporter
MTTRDAAPSNLPVDGEPPAGVSAGRRALSPPALLAVLTALNVFAYVDRQLVVTLAPLLIADLGLTRAEIGLLVGASFIVVFAGLNLVLGAAADRFSRPRLIAGGLGVWSVATTLTGAVGGFAQMVVLRIGVGVGEAALSPAALSMLGDRFSPARRGLASSVFYTGIPLGFACSFLLAGSLGSWLGWRACFFGLGVVGAVAVAAVARMADAPRRGVAAAAAPPGARALGRGLGRALAARPAVALVSLAGALLAFMSSAAQHTITWLVEERGLEYSRAAFLSAAMVAGGGLLGNLAVGALTDLGRRCHPSGRLAGMALLAVLAVPVAAGFYLVPPTSPLFLPLWFLTQAWMLGWFGPVLAALDELAPPGLRATVLGFGLLAINLLGVAPGPFVAGLIGDRVDLTTGLLVGLVVGACAAFPLLAAAWLEARAAAAPSGGDAA